jgi:hypothetical protein
MRRILRLLIDGGRMTATYRRAHDAWSLRLSAEEGVSPDLRVSDETAAAILGMISELDHLDLDTVAEWLDLLPRMTTSLLAIRSTLLTGVAPDDTPAGNLDRHEGSELWVLENLGANGYASAA